MSKIFQNWLTAFWDWIDTRGVIRRIILFAAMWMTFWISFRMTEFVFAALALGKISEGSIVAAIGMITAPIVALGGYVFKAYLDSRAT
jgi:hypothetical protein